MANFTEWLNAERWDLIRDYLLGRRRTVAWVDQSNNAAEIISDTQLIEASKCQSLPEDILTLILSKVDLNRAFPPPSYNNNINDNNNINNNANSSLERKETALHGAAEEGSETTLKVLLETLQPTQRRCEEIFREDGDGKTVMDKLWTKFVSRHMSQLESVTTFQELSYNSLVMELWNKTTLLLLAARPSRLNHVLLDGSQYNATHAILSHRGALMMTNDASSSTSSSNHHRSCPSIILHLALKLYPYQPTHPDEHGFYPLHLSILNPTHHALHPSLLPPNSPSSHTALLNEANIIPPLQLLKVHPQAASIPHPTSGQYPLHMALRSYHEYHALHKCRFRREDEGSQARNSWMYNHHHHQQQQHQDSSSSSSSSSSSLNALSSSSSTSNNNDVLNIPQHHQPTPWDNLIFQLITLHPAALSIPDRQPPAQPSSSTESISTSSSSNSTTSANNNHNNNLLPFFYAASIPSMNLTTLFTLLRSNPSILKNVIKTTRQERYLTEKVLRLKRERDGMECLIEELRAKVAKLEQQVDEKTGGDGGGGGEDFKGKKEEGKKVGGGKKEEKEEKHVVGKESLDVVTSNDDAANDGKKRSRKDDTSNIDNNNSSSSSSSSGNDKKRKKSSENGDNGQKKKNSP